MNKNTNFQKHSTPLPTREGIGGGSGIESSAMDRAIPVSEQRKRKIKKAAAWTGGFLAVLGIAAWLGTQMIPTLDKKALVISDVDRGTIDVSVSATGKVVPAFEEVIVSPISSRILEVYAHSGDSVDVGTPLCRLDLQSAETDYAKALDEKFLDMVTEAARNAGLPASVDVALKTTATRLQEDENLSELVSVETSETCKFTKPKKEKED